MKIYGYLFKLVTEKADWGYTAFAPGVGGVYEEAATKKEALSNAYEAACAILETRLERNDPITINNSNIVVLTAPPNLQHIISTRAIPDTYIATPRCLATAGVN